jgi:hypothetical protein
MSGTIGAAMAATMISSVRRLTGMRRIDRMFEYDLPRSDRRSKFGVSVRSRRGGPSIQRW